MGQFDEESCRRCRETITVYYDEIRGCEQVSCCRCDRELENLEKFLILHGLLAEAKQFDVEKENEWQDAVETREVNESESER
jgi:hypothetical protein